MVEFKNVKVFEFLSGDSRGMFVLRVRGDSMFPEIEDGDAVVCNSNQQPKFGEKIVALVNGEYTLKSFKHSYLGLRLVASNGNYREKQITKNDDFQIVGVVSHVIKKI